MAKNNASTYIDILFRTSTQYKVAVLSLKNLLTSTLLTGTLKRTFTRRDINGLISRWFHGQTKLGK